MSLTLRSSALASTSSARPLRELRAMAPRSAHGIMLRRAGGSPAALKSSRIVAAKASSSSAPPAPEMTVNQIAVKNPICFRENLPVKDAVKIMLDKNISGGPVVDADGKLVGIISESDIIWKGAGVPQDHYLIPPTYISIIDSIIQLRDEAKVLDDEHKILSRTVGEAMTKEVVTVAPTATLSAACQLMLAKQVNRLPVVEGGRVVGVLTRHDMLKGIYATKAFL